MAEQNKPKISYEEKIYRKYINFLNEHEEEMEKTSKWDMVFKVLNKIYIHHHYKLDDYRGDIPDSILKLFARHRSTPCYKECEERMLDYFRTLPRRKLKKDEIPFMPPFIPPYQLLAVEMTPKALWQAFLLHNTCHFTGMRQSGRFDKRNFVFNEKDVESEFTDETLDYEKIKNLISLPKFIKDDQLDDWDEDEINYLEYCYWNDWEGLVKEKVKILYEHFNKVAKFETVSSQVLYEYNCRVLF